MDKSDIFHASMHPKAWMMYIPFLLALTLPTLLIHRGFFVTITFTDQQIIYKSFRRKLFYNIGDVKQIVIIKKARHVTEFLPYNDAIASRSLFANYFVMLNIGKSYYPQGHFLITSPIKPEYIIVQYRDEMKTVLDEIRNPRR